MAATPLFLFMPGLISAGFADPVVRALLALTLIIVAAKLGGELLGRLGQPPVLGELLVGVLLGNLPLFGITALEPLRHNEMLHVLGEIGAILLLFEVGIESDLFQLLAVGWSALVVAMLGIIAPLGLGYFVSAALLPEAGWLTPLFVGGTLTATSVGITARVFKDLGKSDTKEARIILGAAVVDDVIGLVVLAIVSGLVTTAAGSGVANLDWSAIAWIVGKAALFLLLALVIGRFWSQKIFVNAARLQVPGVLIGLCICFCFVNAALAGLVGLAPIVGSFAAGVVLDEVHYRPFRERGEHRVDELLFPITTLVVPVFFVMMGFRVDLRTFTSPAVVGFAALITLVAIAAKQICGLGVLERGPSRLAIGIGMIPRGEVGLIFAGLGSTLVLAGQPVLPPTVFSALVLMVMLTTFITPPLLKFVLERKR